MSESRTVPLLVAGVVAAMALGGLATFFRLLPDAAATLPSAVTFVLCVVAVIVGSVSGAGGQPTETPYWR